MTDQAMRAPQQERSRRTLERILLASVEILREGGWDAVTVGEVERRSGVSRGAFYTRFPTRDALLAYVADQVIAGITVDQREGFAAVHAATYSTLSEAAHGAVSAIAALFEKHGPVLLQMDTTRMEPGGWRPIDELSELFMQTVSPFIDASGEGELGVEFTLRLVFDSLVARTRRPNPFASHVELSWAEYVERLGDVAVAYLATFARSSAS